MGQDGSAHESSLPPSSPIRRAPGLLEESSAWLRRQEERALLANALVNTLNRLESIACEAGAAARAAARYREGLELVWRFVGTAFETAACLKGLARRADGPRPRRARRSRGARGRGVRARMGREPRG